MMCYRQPIADEDGARTLQQTCVTFRYKPTYQERLLDKANRVKPWGSSHFLGQIWR
ncbi:hypothetical protein COMA1_20138 [Candidatus Nitrospira nitrosa]|uniref:Uncharacterized protein n=1 Tax=Candidatus Nitrospira nitrosa TaxID=1742972 RepID=A0A0S4LEP8_9BACT|nr:hypothetical protein COMA1_20138 [Candidatus Nitrospira nitrosa]